MLECVQGKGTDAPPPGVAIRPFKDRSEGGEIGLGAREPKHRGAGLLHQNDTVVLIGSRKVAQTMHAAILCLGGSRRE
jgi:hypothetical protein